MDLFWRIGGFYSHRQYKIRQHLPLTNRTLRHQPRALGIMAMYRYLTRANPDDNSGLPSVVTRLSSREVERVNRTVKLAMERDAEATSTVQRLLGDRESKDCVWSSASGKYQYPRLPSIKSPK